VAAAARAPWSSDRRTGLLPVAIALTSSGPRAAIEPVRQAAQGTDECGGQRVDRLVVDVPGELRGEIGLFGFRARVHPGSMMLDIFTVSC
jgi:hypothetical protein